MAQQEIELSVPPPPPSQTECPSFIFNVSSVLENDHRMSYKPQLVSIGPYHHNRGGHLRMMEEHKQRYLDNLLRRVNVTLDHLLRQIGDAMEPEIRNCYWSPFNNINYNDFLRMVVVDGCFVIEFFRMRGKIVSYSDVDPLFSIISINNILLRDLMLAENQLPFTILEILYDRTKEEASITLSELIVKVLNYPLNGSLNFVQSKDQTVKHLLDLVRQSLIPTPPQQGNDDSDHVRTKTIRGFLRLRRQGNDKSNPVRTIPSPSSNNSNPVRTNPIRGIHDLRRAGIQICLKESIQSPIAVEFNRKRGKLLIPKLELTDFTFPLFRNFVCLEQCSVRSSKEMTTYFFFLSSLIHMEQDVHYLCKKGIIVNAFDTSATVISLIHQILAGASFDINNCYLAELFDEVNKYCGRRWHTQFAILKHTYCNTPWTFLSVVTAFIILTSTVISTVFTVLSYYRRDN